MDPVVLNQVSKFLNRSGSALFGRAWVKSSRAVARTGFRSGPTGPVLDS
ncbi:MAG: hypothetical protein JRE23_15280 [Deltaproteobacteria bacterium]|nr:hypothetical protein [Deltaproteobacteria bacterium]